MHLTNCLHPVEIIRNGEKLHVPCGKCDYCRFVRASSMSQRLKMEMDSHKFGVFGTLTYADMFLPKMVYSPDARGFLIPSLSRGSDNILSDSENLEFLSFPYMDKKSKDYIDFRMQNFGFIPILRVKDSQNFFKRLRINLKRLLKYDSKEKENYQITYAVCGEYGPTTLRPHLHFVILFDNDSICKVIFKAIHKSWPFGSSRSRFTNRDEDGHYLSKYLNGSYNNPNLLKTRKIRPFFLASKSHPLGLNTYSKEEIQNVVLTGSPTLDYFDARTGCVTEFPLWKVFEDRLFPRFTGFDCVSHRCRIRLLGTAAESSSLQEYITLMYHTDLQSWKSFYADINTWWYDSEFYNFLDCHYRSRVLPMDLSPIVDNCLKSIYYCAKRIIKNMHEFCVDSISDYLDIIYRYYKNKESFRLQKQFELEESVMKSNPELINSIDLDCFCDAVLDSNDMKPLLNNIRYMRDHSKKNKEKNEYKILHPENCYTVRTDTFIEGFK